MNSIKSKLSAVTCYSYPPDPFIGRFAFLSGAVRKIDILVFWWFNNE